MAKNGFEQGMVCAAQIMFSQGNETHAFEIMQCCGRLDITEFDENDHPVILAYQEHCQGKHRHNRRLHRHFTKQAKKGTD